MRNADVGVSLRFFILYRFCTFKKNARSSDTLSEIRSKRINNIEQETVRVYTSLYSLWFMDDIISELEDSKINEKIKREIKLWIENIVECQNFVEGTKWKPYY